MIDGFGRLTRDCTLPAKTVLRVAIEVYLRVGPGSAHFLPKGANALEGDQRIGVAVKNEHFGFDLPRLSR